MNAPDETVYDEPGTMLHRLAMMGRTVDSTPEGFSTRWTDEEITELKECIAPKTDEERHGME